MQFDTFIEVVVCFPFGNAPPHSSLEKKSLEKGDCSVARRSTMEEARKRSHIEATDVNAAESLPVASAKDLLVYLTPQHIGGLKPNHTKSASRVPTGATTSSPEYHGV